VVDLNAHCADPVGDLGTLTNNLTYVPVEPKLSIAYDLKAKSANFTHSINVTIPADAIAFALVYDLSAYGFVKVYNNTALLLTFVTGPDTIYHTTSLGDPSSEVDPRDKLCIETRLPNVDDTANITIRTFRSYTYTNSSDKLSMSFTAKGVLDGYAPRMFFTVPHDAMAFYLTGSSSTAFCSVWICRLNYTELYIATGPVFHLSYETSMGDAASCIAPGETLFIQPTLLNGDLVTLELATIRNYTYQTAQEELNIDWTFTAPFNNSYQRVLFTVPENAISVNFRGMFDQVTWVELFLLNGTSLGHQTATTYMLKHDTTLGDPASQIGHGQVMYFDVVSTHKLDSGWMHVFAINNYTYSNASDALAVRFNFTAPVDLCTHQFVFTIPANAS
jgi:hypothetical protein